MQQQQQQQRQQILLKITRSVSGMKFPYGLLSAADREFVEENVGECFIGERINMNYYKLKCGPLVHIYNAAERELM